MTILFVGGGTLGPVTPLIAVLRKLRVQHPEARFAWAGTVDGPERQVVAVENIDFHIIPVAKLPRHLSLKWLTWPNDYLAARQASRKLIRSLKPDLVVGAGGFTQVPIMRAAAAKGIACSIHQLDKEPGLSNRAVVKSCKRVTTSFMYDVPPFGADIKTERVPTPCRFAGASLPDRAEACRYFGLDVAKPVILVMGGGTGAKAINDTIDKLREELLEHAGIVHVTGLGKLGKRLPHPQHAVRGALDETGMRMAYAAADIVISRAGMGSLTELAALSKPAIVIPMPDSHQELNASALGEAAVRLRQDATLDKTLPTAAIALLGDTTRRATLGAALHAALPTDDGTALAASLATLLPTSTG